MEIKKNTEKEQWDAWLLQQENPSYLQSWTWGELMQSISQPVERLGIEENGKILAQAQIIYRPLPLGHQYAFCPKGPVLAKAVDRKKIYQALKKYFQEQGCIFLRIEPEEYPEDVPVTDTKEINPRATLVMEINKSAEELLVQMHPKTRYNIRLAERKGLRVSAEKDFVVFWKLLQKTGTRDGFTLHPRKNYQAVMSSPEVRQITIYHPNGQAIAAGGFIGFGGTYTYLYGALDYDYRQLMSPYLLQWSAIKQAKELGYRYYDFFGVAPRTNETGEYIYDEKHPYAGITKFKLGFNAQPQSAPGTLDLIIEEKKYKLYKLLRKLRNMLS